MTTVSRASPLLQHPLFNGNGPSPSSKASKAIQAKLDKLGLFTAHDLLLHLPLRYQDETRIYLIAHAPLGQAALVEGEITDTTVQYRPRRTLVCRIEDGSGMMTLRFLNFYPSQIKQLAAGKRVRLFGEMRHGFIGMEMVHPQYRMVSENMPVAEALTPIYPTTAGLGQSALRKLVQAALAECDLADTLPNEYCTRWVWPAFAESIGLSAPAPAGCTASVAGRTHPPILAAAQVRRTAGTAAFHAPALPATTRAICRPDATPATTHPRPAGSAAVPLTAPSSTS